MKKVDYMKSSGWKRIKVNDRTKNRTGQLRELGSYRQLTKLIANT